MKILMFGMSSYPGGIESYIANTFLCEDVSKLLNIDFVTYETSLAYSDSIIKNNHRIIFLPHLKRKPFGYLTSLIKILKRNNYDCIYVNMLTAANILPILIPRLLGYKKIIVHAHANSTIKGFLRKFLHHTNKYFCNKFASLRLACSNEALEWIYSKSVGTAPMIVIPNAIDTKRFVFSETKRNEIREKFNLQESDTVIGSIGRLSSEKNHLFIINILHEITKKNPHYKFMLVGDGVLYHNLVEKVSQLGLERHVIFTGTQVNTEDFYSAFDIFIFPSTFEGFGISALEAQASGLPCICSDTLSKELDVSKTVHFLSLKSGAQKWAEEIINLDKKRLQINNLIENSPYSTRTQNKKILELLLNFERE